MTDTKQRKDSNCKILLCGFPFESSCLQLWTIIINKEILWVPMAWEEQLEMIMTQNNPSQENCLMTAAGLTALWRIRKSASGHAKCRGKRDKAWVPVDTPGSPPDSLCSTMGSVRSWLALTVNSQWGRCFLSMLKGLRHFLPFNPGPFFFQRTGKASRDSHSDRSWARC